jgi:hypothetical protein
MAGAKTGRDHQRTAPAAMSDEAQLAATVRRVASNPRSASWSPGGRLRLQVLDPPLRSGLPSWSASCSGASMAAYLDWEGRQVATLKGTGPG